MVVAFVFGRIVGAAINLLCNLGEITFTLGPPCVCYNMGPTLLSSSPIGYSRNEQDRGSDKSLQAAKMLQ